MRWRRRLVANEKHHEDSLTTFREGCEGGASQDGLCWAIKKLQGFPQRHVAVDHLLPAAAHAAGAGALLHAQLDKDTAPDGLWQGGEGCGLRVAQAV